MLDKAEALEVTNPLARFQKANVYFSLGDYDTALKEAQGSS